MMTTGTALSALLAAMFVMAPQNSADFSKKPEVNSVRKYATTISIPGDPNSGMPDVEVKMGSTEKTVAVDAETVTSETVVTAFDVLLGGQPLDPAMLGDAAEQMKKPAKMVYKHDGTLVKAEGGDSMMSDPRMARMMSRKIPTGTVEPGTVWEMEYPGDKAKGLESAKARWTYVGVETRANRPAYRIDYVFAELDSAQGMSVTGTVWMNSKDMTLIEMIAEMQNVSFNPMMPPSAGKMVTKLVD